ncbi:MAG: heavy metal-responsive transcriptional regulator [Opitutales bacterium]|nr:heavy metal-responsive transcriptional regulator [Opitutales bacterium]
MLSSESARLRNLWVEDAYSGACLWQDVDGEANYTIGQLAKEANIGVETIRFYEREGLLPEPRRTHSNYRKYASGALDRLRFVRHAKDLGFTLEEIRRLLSLSENSHADAGTFHVLAEEKIRWIDERISQLQNMRDILSAAVDSCPGHGTDKSKCPILELFIGHELDRK